MQKYYKRLEELLINLPEAMKTHGEEYCYNSLSEIISNLSIQRESFSTERDKEEIVKFRNKFLPYILQSPFAKHCYKKPFGYSGDYITQELIWLGRTYGKIFRYTGTTELGKCLNALNFKMENMCANEHRVKYLQGVILDTKPNASVASIGCGSCLELWRLEDKRKEPINFFLLDQEKLTLKSAEKNISTNGIIRANYHQSNILKSILNKKNEGLGLRDLIYVFGLLDYFPVKSAQRIVKALFNYIKPGGVLVVTNAHPSNPTKLWMEYGGEWFLNYKTKEEMENLLNGLSAIDDIDLYVDPFNVYQYLTIRKKT